jgi:hypothetical protein
MRQSDNLARTVLGLSVGRATQAGVRAKQSGNVQKANGRAPRGGVTAVPIVVQSRQAVTTAFNTNSTVNSRLRELALDRPPMVPNPR